MKPMFHRLIAVCLTVLCLLGLSPMLDSVFSPPAYAAVQKAQTGEVFVVKVKKLNVRSGPSVKQKVKAQLKKGTEVTFRKSEKGWWYVDYPKGNGYVDGKYLKKKDAGSSAVALTDVNQTHSTTCNLRMRTKPSFKGKIVGTLRKGTAVTVLSQNGKWSEIRYNNKNVWVYSKLLKKK